jgi:hypothetical protein
MLSKIMKQESILLLSSLLSLFFIKCIAQNIPGFGQPFNPFLPPTKSLTIANTEQLISIPGLQPIQIPNFSKIFNSQTQSPSFLVPKSQINPTPAQSSVQINPTSIQSSVKINPTPIQSSVKINPIPIQSLTPNQHSHATNQTSVAPNVNAQNTMPIVASTPTGNYPSQQSTKSPPSSGSQNIPQSIPQDVQRSITKIAWKEDEKPCIVVR